MVPLAFCIAVVLHDMHGFTVSLAMHRMDGNVCFDTLRVDTPYRISQRTSFETVQTNQLTGAGGNTGRMKRNKSSYAYELV